MSKSSFKNITFNFFEEKQAVAYARNKIHVCNRDRE